MEKNLVTLLLPTAQDTKKMDNKLISFIIPCFNSDEKIIACVASIVENTQTTEKEIIIIDDASDDEKSLSILETLKAEKYITILRNKENKGAGFSRNRGIEVSSGKYIHFIDSDDLLTANPVNYIVGNFDFFLFRYSILENGIYKNEFPSDEAIYRSIIIKNGSGTLEIKKNPWISGLTNHIWSFVFSKKFITRNNMNFSESTCFNDVFFFWQAMAFSEKIKFIDERIISYRNSHSSNQLTSKKGKSRVGSLFVYDESENSVNSKKELIPYFEFSKNKALCWFRLSDPENQEEYHLNSKKTLYSVDERSYIYGTGSKALSFFKSIKNAESQIIGFIDSDKSKSGQTFLGKPVTHPGKINRSEKIIIASNFISEITDLVESNGLMNYTYMEACKLIIEE